MGGYYYYSDAAKQSQQVREAQDRILLGKENPEKVKSEYPSAISSRINLAISPDKTTYSDTPAVQIGNKVYTQAAPEVKKVEKANRGERLNAGEIVKLSRITGISQRDIAQREINRQKAYESTIRNIKTRNIQLPQESITIKSINRKQPESYSDRLIRLGNPNVSTKQPKPTPAVIERSRQGYYPQNTSVVTPEEIQKATAKPKSRIDKVKSFLMQERLPKDTTGIYYIAENGRRTPVTPFTITSTPFAPKAAKGAGLVARGTRAVLKNPYSATFLRSIGITAAIQPAAKTGAKIGAPSSQRDIVNAPDYNLIVGAAEQARAKEIYKLDITEDAGFLQTAALKSQAGAKGIAYGINPSFSSKAAKEAYIKTFIAEGKKRGYKEEQLRPLAKRQAISQSVAEGLGLASIATSTEVAAQRSFAGLFQKQAGQKIKTGKIFSPQLFKQAFPRLAGFGAIEGGTSVAAQQQARFDTRPIGLKAKDIAIGAGFGAGSAGTIGGGIVAINPARKGLQKAALGAAYFTDPFEAIGDFGGAPVVRAAQRRILKRTIITPAISTTTRPDITATETKGFRSVSVTKKGGKTRQFAVNIWQPTQTTTKRQKPPKRNIFTRILNPNFTTQPTTTKSTSITPSSTATPSLSPTGIFSPSTTPSTQPTQQTQPSIIPSNTIQSTINNISNPSPSPSQTSQQTNTFTNTFSFTPTAIPTPTPMFRVPPPLPLAFPAGSGKGASRKGKRKTYRNELEEGLKALNRFLGVRPQKAPKKKKR